MPTITTIIKAHRTAFVSLLIIAGSIVLAAWIVGVSKILHDLTHPRLGWLAALAGAMVLSYGAYAIAYREFFGLSRGRAARLTLYGFSPLVALGGFAFDSKSHGRTARMRVAGLAAAEYVVLAPAAWAAALVTLLEYSHVPLTLSLPWIICVPVGLAAAALAVYWRRKLPARFSRFTESLLKEMKGLGFKCWLAVTLSIALYWFGELAALYAALRMFGEGLGIPALILAFASGYILTRRSSPAGFAGLIIILLILMLHLVGIRYGAAFLATYSYLIVSILLPIGFLAVTRRRLNLRLLRRIIYS